MSKTKPDVGAAGSAVACGCISFGGVRPYSLGGGGESTAGTNFFCKNVIVLLTET
jgi:hypothetical protein